MKSSLALVKLVDDYRRSTKKIQKTLAQMFASITTIDTANISSLAAGDSMDRAAFLSCRQTLLIVASKAADVETEISSIKSSINTVVQQLVAESPTKSSVVPEVFYENKRKEFRPLRTLFFRGADKSTEYESSL